MNKTALFLLLFVSVLGFRVSAQSTYYYLNYQWEDTPGYQVGTEHPSAILLHKEVFEYVPGAEGGVTVHRIVHKAIRLSDDMAVESYNKLVIPIGSGQKLSRITARTILSDGTIQQLDGNSLRDLSNLEEYGSFKIFAIEGASAGTLVEYVYILEEENLLTEMIAFQEDIPVTEAELILRVPNYLTFEVLSYNGFEKAKTYKNGDLTEWRAKTLNLKPNREELYSTVSANRASVAFRAKNNTAGENPEQEILSWDMVAATFRNLTAPTKVKEAKTVCKKAGIKQSQSTFEKVTRLENYLKTSLSIQDGAPFAGVSDVLKNKSGSELGVMRVYTSLLAYLGVPLEVVATSNRYNRKLDPEFPSYDALTDFMIYIPAEKKYLCPARIEQRFGIPAIQAANNYGLFTGVKNHRIEFIPLSTAAENMSTHESMIAFLPDFSGVKVTKNNGWTGYRAATQRAVYVLGDEGMKKNVTTDFATSGIDDASIEWYAIRQEDINLGSTDKPLLLETVFTSSSLLENAGNSYLLKLGLVIGEQSELYGEEQRVNPIEMDHPITYTHRIRFAVPAGYRVSGLEMANFTKTCTLKGKTVAEFDSKVSQQGNEIVVEAKEFYTDISLPKEVYPSFREVINAAADFNKIVFVLEPE